MKKTVSLSSSGLIVLVALFIALFANTTFFSRAFAAYPASFGNLVFLASLFVFLTLSLVLVLSLLCHYKGVKPVLIMFLLMSAAAAYFMDQYSAIIDSGVVSSMLKTDKREVGDLFSLKLMAYLLLLGLLPSLFVYRARLHYPGHWPETLLRLKLVFVSLAMMLFVFLAQGAHYFSFFRVHQDIQARANPVFALYSVAHQLYKTVNSRPAVFIKIALDAKKNAGAHGQKLVIMVVGETARSDHFSLNGYVRETNPRLRQLEVINFTDFWSCGTLTIDSVPCMFSRLKRTQFSRRRARNQQNALDVMQRLGVSVLWRDNNSSSKGVADRIPYEDFLTSKTNPICDMECRDEGMLSGLQDYVDGHGKGDIMIVLHQMGNHGPAYFKRYPRSFTKFHPVCLTSELSSCRVKDIINAYDNAVLYTDYFLSRVIEFLKKNDARFATTMIYMSDHGESLGEKGAYLHGYPYMLAPDVQKHVPAIVWLGKNFDKDKRLNLQKRRSAKLSHDNLFSTLLGLFEIQSNDYVPQMDLFAPTQETTGLAR